MGIFDTARKLYSSDPSLAWIIIIFSIVMPCFKFVGTGYLLFSSRNHKKITKAIGLVSKWSMADVFIVSILIAVAKSTSLAGTELLSGIYFFVYATLMMGIIDTHYFLKDS